MSDIDFYVDAVLRNEVLDISLGSTPEIWEGRLGHEFLDDVRRSRMRRDYGLIEVAFTRQKDIWLAVLVSLQVHRLAWTREGMVPSVLEDAWGSFSSTVPFDSFETVLRARGGDLVEDPQASSGDFKHFRIPTTKASVYVVGERAEVKLVEGSIWSIILHPNSC